MAKYVRRRRKTRRLSLFGFSVVFLMFSLFSLLLCSLFVNTTNTNLTIKIQKMQEEIASIENENKSINIEIQSLENKERVYVIAEASNMNLDQSNIISVSGE